MEEMMETMHGIMKTLDIKHKIESKMYSCSGKTFRKKTLLSMLLNEMLALCDCRSGSILMIDHATRELIFEIVRGPRSRKLSGLRIPVSKGIVGWVATNGKVAWVSQPGTDNRFDPKISLDLKVPARSILCAPILLGEIVIGVMEIIHSRTGADFKPFHVELLQSLCLEAGHIIKRAAELEENTRRVNHLNTLTRISKAITSERSLSRLLHLIADSATRLMKSEAGSIVLKDVTSGELVFEATDKKHMQVLKMRLASGTGIIGKVINTGEKLIIEDFQRDERSCKKVDAKTGFTTHSALCVPIKSGDTVIGALEVLNRIVPEPFSLEDLKLFEALADLSSVAIQNARLYESLLEQIARLEKKNIELQNARARLMNSDKLAIVGEMAAGMSHEIRNLITPIRLIVEDLPKPEDIDPETVAEEYKIIKEQVDRATEMTSGMLSFSRRSTSDETSFDVNTIIRKCVEVIKYRYKNSQVKLRTILENNLPAIRGVPSQIEQVIINLINNAENAIAGPGSITVSTMLVENQVCITIKDTGCGIKKEDLEKIWQPFFTTKDEKTGTGLGLAICANIINKHNGEITVTSKENKGSLFTIRLKPVQNKGKT